MGTICRALFPLYRPIKVVPAQPGRSRSTAPELRLDCGRCVQRAERQTLPQVEIISQSNISMPYSFIEELAKHIAEIRGEEANPVDCLPKDASDVTDDAESEFAPWDDENTSGD